MCVGRGIPAQQQASETPLPSLGKQARSLQIRSEKQRISLKRSPRTGQAGRSLQAPWAYPEGGVEVDVVGAAHLLVLLLRAVQRSHSDGSSPI